VPPPGEERGGVATRAASKVEGASWRCQGRRPQH
jgi:hypothetical protein